MEKRTVPLDVLDRIVCIRLDVTIWSGQKKLTAEDLGLTPEQVPPEELAALGRKRICDPKDLAVFAKLKQRGVRLLSQHGVRFLDGYALPADKLGDISAQLDDLGQEFLAAKADFLAEYDNAVESWVARHPDWQEQLRRAIAPVERVAAALQWRRVSYGVVHPQTGTDPGLAEELGGLGGQLLREVAQEAKEAFEESYKDKAEVTRRALWPVQRLYEKMRSLSFLAPQVKPFLDLMATVISNADGQPGPIAGQALLQLQSLLRLLRRPDDILAGNYPVSQAHEAKPKMAQAAETEEPEALPTVLPEPSEQPAWFF